MDNFVLRSINLPLYLDAALGSLALRRGCSKQNLILKLLQEDMERLSMADPILAEILNIPKT